MDPWRVTHNAGAECFSKIQQCLGECGLYQSGADGQKNDVRWIYLSNRGK